MKKVKVAVVGYGFISGKGHVPAFLKRSDVEVVAVADISQERRALAAEALPKARIFSSFEELLASGTEIDVIDVATPPCDHAKIAIAALEAGYHVLCEKPLATTTAEARAMLAAAAKNERVLFPCHNYKHAPVVKVIQDAIDSGRIGEVTSVTLQTFRNTHAKGVKEWRTDWRRDFKTSGGGIAMDHGSHTFYLTFAWLKALPIALTAKAVNLSPDWDTEDNLTVSLEFPGKRFAHSHLSWTAGMRKVIYTVQGTKGGVVVNDDEAEITVGFPNTGSHAGTGDHKVERFTIESDWMDASHTKWFNSMFDKFLSSVDRGDYVNDEIRESYACVEIIEKCYLSSEQKSRELDLDPSPASLGRADV
jgi:predicted dehydrogenase